MNFILLIGAKKREAYSAPRRYYDNDISNKYRVFNNMNTIILLTLIVLILGQLIYFINLIVGISRRKSLLTNNSS